MVCTIQLPCLSSLRIECNASVKFVSNSFSRRGERLRERKKSNKSIGMTPGSLLVGEAEDKIICILAS